MTTARIIAAVAAALAVAAVAFRRWLTRRKIAQLSRDLDAARATADVADRHAELTIAQAHADDDGRRAAEEIAHVPSSGTPADRVLAVDAAARRLSDEDDPADPGAGRSPALPPVR